MKTCVFLIGTNCSGKTSLAKALITRLGGAKHATKWLTEVGDSRYCFAGKYSEESRYGGVDGWNETKPLRGVVEHALTTHEVILCEGVKLHNNGANLSNALYAAEQRLVCLLYAPAQVLNERLKSRSGSQVSLAILKDQQACARSLQKWQKMGGINVMHLDTSTMTIDECADTLLAKIKSIAGI